MLAFASNSLLCRLALKHTGIDAATFTTIRLISGAIMLGLVVGMRRGVAYSLNWQKIPPAQMVMYPLDPSSPILNEPSSGISFTDVMSYWWDATGRVAYDVGDLMEVASGGDASLLLGTVASDRNSHGTLTSCMDGRLTLQTFSSHSLTYNSGTLLWENMIYNALRTRFNGPQP